MVVLILDGQQKPGSNCKNDKLWVYNVTAGENLGAHRARKSYA